MIARMAADRSEPDTPERPLGSAHVASVVVGAIIGVGIFFTPVFYSVVRWLGGDTPKKSETPLSPAEPAVH